MPGAQPSHDPKPNHAQQALTTLFEKIPEALVEAVDNLNSARNISANDHDKIVHSVKGDLAHALAVNSRLNFPAVVELHKAEVSKFLEATANEIITWLEQKGGVKKWDVAHEQQYTERLVKEFLRQPGVADAVNSVIRHCYPSEWCAPGEALHFQIVTTLGMLKLARQSLSPEQFKKHIGWET